MRGLEFNSPEIWEDKLKKIKIFNLPNINDQWDMFEWWTWVFNKRKYILIIKYDPYLLCGVFQLFIIYLFIIFGGFKTLKPNDIGYKFLLLITITNLD